MCIDTRRTPALVSSPVNVHAHSSDFSANTTANTTANIAAENELVSASRAVAIIPARFDSTRLPGKPLLHICNRPMILHTVAQAQSANTIRRVIVAADDERIIDVCERAGVEAVMTSLKHRSGTDRIAEVAAKLSEDEARIIVNVQGDEPFISPDTINRAVNQIYKDSRAVVTTTCERITTAADVLNPNVVKVVCDVNSHALYFSRSPIPYPRELVRRHGTLEAGLMNEPESLALFRKHTGLYVYRREFLLEYAGLFTTPHENTEALEQLRILERGFTIGVVEVEHTSHGIDTQDDLEQARRYVESQSDDFKS